MRQNDQLNAYLIPLFDDGILVFYRSNSFVSIVKHIPPSAHIQFERNFVFPHLSAVFFLYLRDKFSI